MEDWAILLVILAGAAAVVVAVMLWRRRAQTVDADAWAARVRALWMDGGHGPLQTADPTQFGAPDGGRTYLSVLADGNVVFDLYRDEKEKGMIWAHAQVRLAEDGLTPAQGALFLQAIATALKALLPKLSSADVDTYLASYHDSILASCHEMLRPGAEHNGRMYKTDRIQMGVYIKASPLTVACQLHCRF